MPSADFAAATGRQQVTWSTGDFHRIGVAHLIVGELLVRDLHVHAGEKVLDVAGGAGNTALAAARRWAEVTCTDYVPDLLDRASSRAAAEGLPLTVTPADAQRLPFPDQAFDVVTSTFGVMFAPDQHTAASEMLRVLRPGGRLGLVNWTPDSWPARQSKLVATYRPPPAGVPSPYLWGTPERVEELLAGRVTALAVTTGHTDFTHHSVPALFDLFSTWFGPVATLYTTLDPPGRDRFRAEWIALTDAVNTARDGTCDIPAGYLEVIAVRT
jgi:SAM-dependent methyltransferase